MTIALPNETFLAKINLIYGPITEKWFIQSDLIII